MKPIRTRDNLIELAAQHAPSRACERAIREGLITVHGGFVSPVGLPGWIVEITSQRGRKWLVAIWCDEEHRRYTITSPSHILWQNWIGESNGRRPLIDGDTPLLAAYNRMKARKHDGAAETSASGSAEADGVE